MKTQRKPRRRAARPANEVFARWLSDPQCRQEDGRLRAAVDNVLGREREHLEQAVFADELSTESLQLARLVPLLEGLIAEDVRLGRTQDQRLRVGLYCYTSPMGENT